MAARRRTGHPAPDGARSPARAATPARPGAELLWKYRVLVAKYEQLVRRHNEDFADRSSAVTLALAALRASRDGIALFGENRFVTRNARWLELADRRVRWACVDSQGQPEGIERLAAALARELLSAGDPGARRSAIGRDGDALAVELRLERVEAHRRPLVIVTAEDVTERVRAEGEAARAREAMLSHERMRLLGELASGVAHDLNNTLHALSLRVGQLAASSLDERQRENVQVLARICADAAERVARLQELGRRREDVPTDSFDVTAVIQEALAVARPEIDERSHVRGVRFEILTDLAASVHAVGSPGELRHVFVNLFLNARDAMPDGGRIWISSRVVGGQAEVTVEDEGTGIAPEHLARVFDPFFTTKGPQGMGLGLAIVQGVMRRLGGEVEAANRAGRGAVLRLTFPMADPAPAAEPGLTEPLPAPGHRLLVVDDDLDNLEATRWVLEDLGEEVDLAASGEEALALVEDGRRYDLVLCDVGMPGLNGWQVAERMKRVAPATRIVLLTGWAQEIARDDPKRAVVDGILGKPLDVPRLRHALHDALAGTAAPSPGAR